MAFVQPSDIERRTDVKLDYQSGARTRMRPRRAEAMAAYRSQLAAASWAWRMDKSTYIT